MKTFQILLLFFVTCFPQIASAYDQTIFPIELSYDTGIEHKYTFKDDGEYILKTSPNEARGYPGGSESGAYSFSSAKGKLIIVLNDGAQIRFKLPNKLNKGESIEVIGMVYSTDGTPRFPDEEMPILLKKI
jgi:hypothetical protein